MSQPLKIFLASSSELKDDRDEFEKFIGRKNKTLSKIGVFIELVIWEDFIDAMSRTRLQDEYNEAVQGCDIFVMLFCSKVGPFTWEEFETAFNQFQQIGKPLIYTYRKEVPINPDNRSDIQSLWAFQDRLKALGHFPTTYSNSDNLINHFNGQLEKLDNKFTISELPSTEEIISDYWQQLADDPEYNSMPVIGCDDRRQLNDLYVRLQVTAEGDKTRVIGKLRGKLTDKNCPEEAIPHELAPDQALNLFRRMVILGAPGIGKTTMFRYIAYTVSLLGLGLARSDEFQLSADKKPVPLYLPLPYLDEYDGNLIDCLKCYLDARLGCKGLISILDSLLCDGRCLLLLDGMDEVTSARLRDVKIKIQGVLNNPTWRNNYIMISCREASWEKNDPSFVVPAVLQVKDMDDEAIGAYLRKWFGVDNSSDALILRDTICSNDRLKQLATNPFLLSLIAWLSRVDILPRRRVDLYSKCTDALLREKHRSETDRHPSVFGIDHDVPKAHALSEVAFAMMRKNIREIKRNELWELIRESLASINIADKQPGQLIDEIHTGSAIWREINKERVYMFQHNTFREYYAANKLANIIDSLLNAWTAAASKQSFSQYCKNAIARQPIDPFQWIDDSLWNEVYRLAVALLDNPTPVLELLFGKNPTLAARCYLDADPEKVDHAVIKRCWTKDIKQEERVKIVQGIQAALKKPREVIDFFAAVFLTGETDTEVLYHCDDVLCRMNTVEATRVSQTMFDHWLKERQFQTHEQAFNQDKYWKKVGIEAGEFKMGGNDDDDEKPIHRVKLSSFRLGKYQVTVGQYQRFDPEHKKHWSKDNEKFFKDDNQPVTFVNWYDAYIFCKWASGRLPAESEWEYAARGGNKSKGYNYSGSNNIDKVAWYNEDWDSGATHPVGKKQENELGLYDMSGNAWEWCQDKWHGDYKGAPTDGSAWETGDSSYRVLRGGSWYFNASNCRSAFRFSVNPDDRSSYCGFRLVFVPQSVGSSSDHAHELKRVVGTE